MRIEIINPHGFCAGVSASVKKAFSLSGKIYSLHQIVHNEIVTKSLRERGFIFAERPYEIPKGSTVLISAHGVSPLVERRLADMGCTIVDVTCPFVKRLHAAVVSFIERGIPIVIIGDRRHIEVIGVAGEAQFRGYSDIEIVRNLDEVHSLRWRSRTKIGVVSQTTMDMSAVSSIVDALEEEYDVEIGASVCCATKERQDAVRAFDGDALLVLGSANSSNALRLCEVSRAKKVFRAGTPEEVERIDFSDVSVLGVTSSASTPESFFERTVKYLRGLK